MQTLSLHPRERCMRSLILVLGALVLAAAGGAGWWLLVAEEASPPGGREPAAGSVVPSETLPGAREPVRVRTEPARETGAARPFTALNNRAVEALEAGDAAGAVELLERCVAGDPESAVYRDNLAEALVRLAFLQRESEHGRELAIPTLERAVELAPGREDLGPLLERWRTELELERDFWSDESARFVLSYDGAREDVLHAYQDVLDMLESAYFDLQLAFRRDPIAEGRPKVRVILYRRAGFGELTGLGDWAGGAFDGRVRVPLEQLDGQRAELRQVLRHELAHWFVREVGGRGVPGWLDEGLAQWLEEGRAADVARARARLAGGEPLPLERLAGSLASWEDEQAVGRAYAQALALVDHVASQYGDDVLFEMVAERARGRRCEDTFEARTNVALDLVLADLYASL